MFTTCHESMLSHLPDHFQQNEQTITEQLLQTLTNSGPHNSEAVSDDAAVVCEGGKMAASDGGSGDETCANDSVASPKTC